jgi:outer membrane protein assembly factor BamB
VEALDAATGKPLWKQDFPASYQGGVDPDHGPRVVPLIQDDRILLFGAAGDLHCVALATGQPQWSRRVYEEFRGNEGYFGAGGSPLVLGDRVLVNAGGSDQAGIVALSLRDGKTLWKATDERASYSSPICVPVGDRTAVAFVTRLNFLVVRPEDGQVLFRTPFGQRGPTVNAATPLAFDRHVFLTANYGVGAQLLQLSEKKLEIVWANDESLSSQYPTPVFHQGYLFGIHGREDVGRASLRCLAAKTGEVQWSQDDFGMAHLILVGEQLLIVTVDGRLLLAKASPDKFQTLAAARLSTATTRALPALADGRLFVRETRDQEGTVKCWALPSP